MPSFQARPVMAEAFPWTGNPADMPEAFAAFVLQAPPDEGWVVVKTPGIGFEILSPGAFEARFVPVRTDEGVAPGEGEASVTYVGDTSDPESTPAVLDWGAYRFPLGVAVGVSDPAFLTKLRGNAHFIVVEPSEATALQAPIVPARRGPGRPPKNALLPQPNPAVFAPALPEEGISHD